MSTADWLLVAGGGALGACARSLLDTRVRSRWPGPLPWGTLLVNVLGSFVLGALVGLGSRLGGSAYLLLGTGFCGALTTFGTFANDNLRLLEERRGGRAAANVALTLAAGIGAAALGWWAGSR